MTAVTQSTVPVLPEVPATRANGVGGWQGGWWQGLSYGALGLPLAFVALPLYVILPKHYATAFGIPLATLGALLLGARLLDAVADPWIGRWADRWFAHSQRRVLLCAVLAAVVLAVGFRGLFFPWVSSGNGDHVALLLWCAALLAVTYLSYSVLSVLHQAWGARLGGDEAQRARIVAWREGLALVGVLVASVLPTVAGLSVASVVFAVTLFIAVALLWWAPVPHALAQATTQATAQASERHSVTVGPFQTPGFRRLMVIYLVNGVAGAVPATLILFFIEDRLQAPTYAPLFLASFFAAAALSMPLWLQLVKRIGLAKAWLRGMLLSITAFIWAAFLGTGDIAAYTAVCIASGVALGADLSLPGALLAGVIQRAGHGQSQEGAYFGWWNFATKLNLALAAGIALPLLALFGYAPGGRSDDALVALTMAYCVLPCVLKAGAAALLWKLWINQDAVT
jgi:glycoside/pentoside/hexuronide:cation symporter, GPH family